MKKSLRVLIVFSVMLAFFSFTSVHADYDAEGVEYRINAMSRLKSESIVVGYADGDLGAKKLITRAEMITLICRAYAEGNRLTEGLYYVPFYSDIPADSKATGAHWATSFINAGSEFGIVNGYPDGTFRPDAPVLYEEAVKMIVCLYGDTNAAYPHGFLRLASGYGIDKHAGGTFGEPATRETVFTLLYNALAVSDDKLEILLEDMR